MKNLKLTITFFTLLIFSLFITSCEKENNLFEDTYINETESRSFIGYPGQSTPEVEKARLELAKYISITFQNDQGLLKKLFRKLCFPEKLNEGSNGLESYIHYENEFFMNLEKDKIQAELGGVSITQHLNKFSGQKAVDVLDYLCSKDPGLAILIEGNIENPTAINEIFVDNDFDDSDLKNLIPAFINGMPTEMNLGALDSHKQSLFIVRESEAFADRNKPYFDTYKIGSACGNDIIVFGCGGCPAGGDDDDDTVTGCPEICDRDCVDKKENLLKFKTKHDFDPGKGKGEWVFAAIFSDEVEVTEDGEGNYEYEGNPLGYVVKGAGSVKDDGKWRVTNFDVIHWDLENDGDRIKWELREDDGGNQVDINLKTTVKYKVPGTGFTLSQQFGIDITDIFSSGDDRIGDFIVDYCDDFSFGYIPYDQVELKCNER